MDPAYRARLSAPHRTSDRVRVVVVSAAGPQASPSQLAFEARLAPSSVGLELVPPRDPAPRPWWRRLLPA